jgi:hypothetical protein
MHYATYTSRFLLSDFMSGCVERWIKHLLYIIDLLYSQEGDRWINTPWGILSCIYDYYALDIIPLLAISVDRDRCDHMTTSAQWTGNRTGVSLLWEICSPVQTQRMHSETHGIQWKWDFNGNLTRSGAWWAETLEVVTTSIILSSGQVSPWVLYWLRTREYTFFPLPKLPRFPIGLFKTCLSWDWSNFRGGL